jgi:arginyl-tRNA synthetase
MTASVSPPLIELQARFRQAVIQAYGHAHADVDPLVRRSDRADFQANLAMSLSKLVGVKNPREVAQALVAALEVTDLCDKVEIAGPGFINLTLKNEYLDRLLQQTSVDPRFGVARATKLDTVVFDYGGPNVAKEMHVGHLRPCAIGDCLVRVLDFVGHRVIRQNHIGDWGTPFGMLIEHLIDRGGADDTSELSVGELNAFYKAARKKFDEDPSFAERARTRVVSLQAGDPTTLELWRILVDASKKHFEKVFARLGVTMTPADTRGESFYNPFLPEIAADLEKRGIAVVEQGALCVFPEGFKNRDGNPLPLMLRKSDGGYGYDATDLAAVRFRAQELHGTRLLYTTDSRQAQHFALVFAGARLAGYIGPDVRTEHAGFGTILGTDKKPLKSRDGDTLRLIELLDEGRERALKLLEERGADMPQDEWPALAEKISLSPPSSTRTFRAIASKTTSSIGIACWRPRAIPVRTCSTRKRDAGHSCASWHRPSRSSPEPSAFSTSGNMRWHCRSPASARRSTPWRNRSSRTDSAASCTSWPAHSARSGWSARC